ncbi:MAG TPA: Sec-independent protein translocase protein TatB, partial [Plasticicumulans sp.]|nr:Sec-independent protein translocase protein TatB [Plasticicumulans sp.]
MFEIGFWELVLIGVVALVVIGPERLPGVARTVGRWVGRARQIVSTVRSEVERELQIEEMKRTIAEHDTAEQFRQLHDQIRTLESELRSSVQGAAPRTAAPPEPLAPPVETAAPLPAAS